MHLSSYAPGRLSCRWPRQQWAVSPAVRAAPHQHRHHLGARKSHRSYSPLTEAGHRTVGPGGVNRRVLSVFPYFMSCLIMRIYHGLLLMTCLYYPGSEYVVTLQVWCQRCWIGVNCHSTSHAPKALTLSPPTATINCIFFSLSRHTLAQQL